MQGVSLGSPIYELVSIRLCMVGVSVEQYDDDWIRKQTLWVTYFELPYQI